MRAANRRNAVRFMTRDISVHLYFGKAFEYKRIPIITIIKRAFDTADGGGRGAGLFCNIEIGSVLPQHGGHFESLRKG